MPVKRLIAIPGPLSLLNVLSVLHFQKAKGEYTRCDDYLAIGDLGGDKTGNQQMMRICRQIAEIWGFRGIFYLAGGKPVANEGEFLKAATDVKNRIQLPSVDAVYTCRNWQYLNEVLLGAYPEARKICYGDGLGHLDLNTKLFGQPMRPSGFVPMDCAYLMTPNALEKDALRNCPITVVGFDYFSSILYACAKKIDGLAAYCGSLVSRFKHAPTLVTTSNLSEAFDRNAVGDEIREYLSCVLELTREGESILVKGHPRQRYSQSGLLAEALSAHKRRAIAASEFTHVPLELFIPFIKIEKAITLNSSCGISLAYCYRSELFVGMGEKAIRRFWPPQRQELGLMNEHLTAVLVGQAYDRVFKPTLYFDLPQPHRFHQSPIHLTCRETAQSQAGTESAVRHPTRKGISSPESIKLYLGCGDKRKDGYINVDKYVSAPGVVAMDPLHLPFDNGVVDVILTEHMLEHLGKHEVPLALREWARVLKPCGRLLMNLPNLEWCLQQWLAKPEEERWGWQLDTIFGLQTHRGEFHQTGFTAARLRALLREAGFSEIRIGDIWSHGQSCFWVEAVPRPLARFGPEFQPEGERWRWATSKGSLTIPRQAFANGARIRFNLSCGRADAYPCFPFKVRVSLDGRPLGEIPFTASYLGHGVEVSGDGTGQDAELCLEIEEPAFSGSATPGREELAGGLYLDGLSVDLPEGSAPGRLRLKPSPIASIIIPVHNKVDYTQRCFDALKRNTPRGLYEIILVDNASSDRTGEFAQSLGAELHVIRNAQNLGFSKACNQGGYLSRCRYVVFLNNDTEVESGWLESLVDEAECDPQVGAVGAKLVYPNGKIQEAGGIIFADGRGWNFGNGDDPRRDLYNRPCEVDYCSAACLLVRRDMFLKLGGLDERYSPAYYEETDLCFGLRKFGFKVVYRPDAVVVHHESTTAGSGPSSFKRFIEINRHKFVAKWKSELASQPPPLGSTQSPPQTADRDARTGRGRSRALVAVGGGRRPESAGKVLIFFPHNPYPPKTGAHQRCLSMLKAFKSLGCDITLASSSLFVDSPWTSHAIASLQREYGVQVHLYCPGPEERNPGRSAASASGASIDWDFYTPPGLKADFRRCFQDLNPAIVMINYANWAGLVDGEEFVQALRIIDSLDLVTLNLTMRRHLDAGLSARPVDPAILDEGFYSGLAPGASSEEYRIFDRFDYTIAISPSEARLIRDNTRSTQTLHIPMATNPVPLNNTYRSDPVFVVGDNPFNLQGYFYFIARVLPGVRKQLKDFALQVAGYGSLRWSAVEGVRILGAVDRIQTLYADAPFAICPLIGATGQQIKIVEAMAHGLAVVALRQAAVNSPLEHGVNGLIADDAESFARWVRLLYERRDVCREMGERARETIRRSFSEDGLRSQLQGLIAASRRPQKASPAPERPIADQAPVPSRTPSSPERIVWLRTDAIGDNILAAGMLEHIRRRHPQAHIAVVCQDHVTAIYDSCPHVDEVVGYSRARFASSEPYRRRLLESLNRPGPTRLLNSVFSRDPMTDLLAIGVRAAQKVGHWGDLVNITSELRSQNNRHYTRLVPEPPQAASELLQHREFLAACGIECASLLPALWLTEEDERFAEQFFDDNQLDRSHTIGLFIGAQSAIRIYPFYGKALAGLCQKHGLRSIAFGSSPEAGLNAKCLNAKGVDAINLCGKTSLRQTAALLKRCRLGVGAETGTAHMACAVGTPNLVLIGGGHFGRFMPYAPSTALVCLPLECYGCNWKCRYSTPHCIRGVDPLILEQAFDAVWEQRPSGPRVFIQSRSDWDPPAGEPQWQWPPANYSGDSVAITLSRPAPVAGSPSREAPADQAFVRQLSRVPENSIAMQSPAAEPAEDPEALRRLRSELAQLWLKSPAGNLQPLYEGDGGSLHRRLLASAANVPPLSRAEREAAEKWAAQLEVAESETEIARLLLASMLYLQPFDLPAEFDFMRVPEWLRQDGFAFLLSVPQFTPRLGQTRAGCERMERLIDRLHSAIREDPHLPSLRKMAAIYAEKSNLLPFYFSRRNLKPIALRRAAIVDYAIGLKGPRLDYAPPPRGTGVQRIRLGIHCRSLRAHTETYATLPVFEHLDPGEFDVRLYVHHRDGNQLEERARRAAAGFTVLPETQKAGVEAIRADDLDILVFGNNITAGAGYSSSLSNYRLARVQCIHFCNPVTSGRRHIDRFLLGKLIAENLDTEAHFSEKILTLEGSGICFDLPDPQPAAAGALNRRDLGIPERATVFISGANYFKIIPELRHTWAKILVQVPDSVLLLYPFSPAWSHHYPQQLLVEGITRVFDQYGVSSERLIVMDALKGREEVLAINRIADVYLDAVPYNGATSLLEPLQEGVPPVVVDGRELRFAQGAAILRELGVPELVVDGEDEYIRLAVRLAADAGLRAAIGQRIRERMTAGPAFLNPRLYAERVSQAFRSLFPELRPQPFQAVSRADRPLAIAGQSAP